VVVLKKRTKGSEDMTMNLPLLCLFCGQIIPGGKTKDVVVGKSKDEDDEAANRQLETEDSQQGSSALTDPCR